MNSMRRVGWFVIWSSCALFTRLFAADSAINSAITKVEQHYNKAKTLSLDFVEEYSIQGRRRPTEMGALTLRKVGKMRWEYSKPAGKVFVSDGKMIYLYTAPDNKVEEIPLKDTEDMRAPLAFLLGHLDLKKEFHDFSLHPDPSGAWLEAVAGNQKTPYSKIAMLVGDGGEISRLNITGRDESQLHFLLSREQVNPVINDALFTFKIPPGAEVVHAIEYTGEDR